MKITPENKENQKMDKSMITQAAILLLWTAGGCLASQPDCAKPCQIPEITCSKDKDNVKPCPADEILKQLNKKTLDLKAYTAQVEYKFIQPLFESEALRKGILYYQKLDKRSKLRINFQTLKQDDEKQQFPNEGSSQVSGIRAQQAGERLCSGRQEPAYHRIYENRRFEKTV